MGHSATVNVSRGGPAPLLPIAEPLGLARFYRAKTRDPVSGGADTKFCALPHAARRHAI